jgi:hypothetical protein
MEFDFFDLRSPDDPYFQRLAAGVYKDLGRKLPATPYQGKTWRKMWEEAVSEIVARQLEASTCRRCKKEPVSGDREICIRCEFEQMGESMFVEKLEVLGVPAEIDHRGLFHFRQLAVGPYWPVLQDKKAAKQWVGQWIKWGLVDANDA